MHILQNKGIVYQVGDKNKFRINVSHQEATQFLKSKSYCGHCNFSCLFRLLRFTVKFHATDVANHANLPQGRQSYKNASINWNQILDLSRDDAGNILPWYPKTGIFIA
jgi:hypothetical protein